MILLIQIYLVVCFLHALLFLFAPFIWRQLPEMAVHVESYDKLSPANKAAAIIGSIVWAAFYCLFWPLFWFTKF